MFEELEKINERPEPFEFYTADDLWTDEHTSRKMLSYHLDESIDASSRNPQFIDKSADWIASVFSIGKNTKIADFGCGPGLYTSRLAMKGACVTGIDFSVRSIEYARNTAARENLSVDYINQDYLAFETEDRFDLVIMIMCDFCALGLLQRREILCKFLSVLKPGGCVLLDVYSLAAFDQRNETAIYRENLLDGFWSSKKYYGFLNTFKYHVEKLVLDKYTIVEAARTRTVYNWMKCFSPAELEKELNECGFSVEGLYSDVAGKPYDQKSSEFAVIFSRKLE